MAIAAVTGAAKRVGRAIALELARAGLDLIVHTKASDLLPLIAEVEAMGRSARAVTADFAEEGGYEGFSEQVLSLTDSLDVLVHNASIYEKQPLSDIRGEDLERALRINLEAPLFISQRLLPALRRGKRACIIHLGDAATERPYRGYAAYFASKAALDSLTRSLAIALAPEVRVNAVAPGTVAFPEDLNDATRESIRSAIPLQRIGSERDVAAAVRFLALEAPFVTGQTLCVDGGRSVKP